MAVRDKTDLGRTSRCRREPAIATDIITMLQWDRARCDHDGPPADTQSRLMSLVEAFANIAVGFGLAVATQAVVFPLFGLVVDTGTNVAIGLIFTVVSIARSFILRRLFEALRLRGA